nr:M23 family metallopeptidase [uncultured Holophaga sp.]
MIPGRALSFTQAFLALNPLPDFEAWHFEPGMGFLDPGSWWGARKARPHPHEGVDLCRYLEARGRVLPLGAGTRIPAVFPGRVVRVLKDFLGMSLFMEHLLPGGRFLTLFGHLSLDEGMAVGRILEAGECLGRIAPARSSPTAPAPHAHLSLARCSSALDPADLDWPDLTERVELLDPRVLL